MNYQKLISNTLTIFKLHLYFSLRAVKVIDDFSLSPLLLILKIKSGKLRPSLLSVLKPESKKVVKPVLCFISNFFVILIRVWLKNY